MKFPSFIISCLMAITLWSGSALAADWNFYGSARVSTFYEDVDNPDGTSTTNFSQALQSNARIGANVRVSDTLVGRFEYGASGGDANIRHLYGEWNFGAGKLLVGQTDTPLNFALSNQVYGNDTGLDGYGHVDGKRNAMIQLTFGSFKVAMVEPKTNTAAGDFDLTALTTESRFPKIEVSYKLDMDRGYIQAAGGYQTYEITDTTSGGSYDVDSYILAIGGQFRAGPAYFNGAAWTGQNVDPYGYNHAPEGSPLVSAGSLYDNDARGFMLAAGYKLNDRFSFELGYGYAQSEPDLAGKSKDKADSYYIQSTITLADGVYFIPEIGRVDEREDSDGVREDDTVYAGAKWQINF